MDFLNLILFPDEPNIFASLQTKEQKSLEFLFLLAEKKSQRIFLKPTGESFAGSSIPKDLLQNTIESLAVFF